MTERQQHIFQFIRGFIAQRGHAPSLDEIAAEFGVTKTTAFDHVAALERDGYIRTARQDGRRVARGIEIIGGDPCPTCGRRPAAAGGAQ